MQILKEMASNNDDDREGFRVVSLFLFLWLILRMSGEDKNTFWKFIYFSYNSCCSTFSCLSTIGDCKNLRHQTD